jgi:hypothetical protein
MASIFDSLCGESGAVNQITELQDQIREQVTAGKNAINAVKGFVDDVNTLNDAIQNQPGVVTRRLQEDIFNILSQEALSNPEGTIAKLLELRSAYQGADAAIDRVIENVEQFIRDPLSTPLNLCEDIPNIVKLGEEVKEFASPAVIPDKPPEPPSVDDLATAIGESDIQTIPRFPSQTIKESIETIGRYSGDLSPGAADQAARGQ